MNTGPMPLGIAAGPDGNLWFAVEAGSQIGKITPTGVITQYQISLTYQDAPTDVTAGPDGNLWFTEVVPGTSGYIGSITTSGKITLYQIPNNGGLPSGSPTSITKGPDGNLWFTDTEGFVGKIVP